MAADTSRSSTDDRAKLARWAVVIAAAAVFAIVLTFVLVQRYRSTPATSDSQAETARSETTSTAQEKTSPSEPTSSTASTSSTETPPPAAETSSTAKPATPISESTTSREKPPQPAFAELTLQQLPPGTRVTLDNNAIGTVGSDGRLARSNIAPGRHTLQFSVKGYDPVTVTREFGSARLVTLTAADIKLTRTPSTLDLQADPATETVIAQNGRTLQQVKGAVKVPLAEGTYDISAKGPAGVVSSVRVSIPAGGGAVPVDLRALIVSGMERFDRTGWTQSEAWVTRRGGNYVLYNRSGDEGTISFTVRLDRNGNPFSSGARLNWVVGFADSRNYILLQLDKDSFYRQAVVNSVPQSATKKDHDIPNNVPYVNLRVQLIGSRLVHEYSTKPNEWRTLDAWATAAVPVTSTRSLLDGRFGFFLPGDEEITISNFLYYPPARAAATAPGR
jgi:cytoskeletal protein RodZ